MIIRERLCSFHRPPAMQSFKIFVGGLSWETTDGESANHSGSLGMLPHLPSFGNQSVLEMQTK